MFASFLLFAVSLAATPAAPPVSFVVSDTGYVLAVCTGRILVPISPIVEEAISGPPHTYETPITDAKGRTSVVKTNCAAYSSLKECAKQHRLAVEAFEEFAFPHVIKKE